MKRSIIFLASLVFSVGLFAQDFHTLWNDPNANFYDIKAAAELYFADKDQSPETEYSRYKRWEHFVEPRVYPSGDLTLMNIGQVYDELKLFKETSRRLKSQPVWTELPVDKFDNISGHWSPGIGRIDRVAVDPTNSATIYAGSPAGGLLKSTDRGRTWRALGDDLPTMGINGIAINPQDPQEIFISTGDGDGGYTYTSGVFKSNDAGETWTMIGPDIDLTSRRNAKDLIMDPTNPDILFVSTSLGIYKTVDEGENWTNVKTGQFDDLCFKPGDPQTVYATTFTGFYKSTDGGETFFKNDTALAGRVLIGVTPANPDVVYLVAGQKGTFKSVDSGDTFTKVADLPVEHKTQGYMFALAVSPSDENELHFGTFNSYRSYDGGANWTLTTNWTWNNTTGYTHCDFHDIVYLGDTIFTCTDGGLSYSTDKGETWTNCFNNANCTQIYEIAVCKTNPDLYMWGSQDNGIYHWDGSQWNAWLGADGMNLVYDYSDPNTRYGSTQNGSFYCSSHGIAQPGKGAWVTPVLIHPTNPNTLFVGNDKVRKSTDGMRNWKVIGSFGGDSYMQEMAIAETNPDFLFASKGASLWRTLNGGQYWTQIDDGLPNLSITRIAVHPRNERVVAVSFSGYNPGKKVYISYDAGLNWINISKNLPNLPTGGLAFDDKWNNALYVGMDVGLYYIDNHQEEWVWYGEGLPNVLVRDIEIHHRSGMLFTGTHGRGLWKIPTQKPSTDYDYCSGSGQVESEASFIEHVFIDNIESFSADDEYLMVEDQYAVLQTSRYYPIEIQLSEDSYQDTVLAWIDWNNDYEFSEDESIELSSADYEHKVSGMITVPVDAEYQMTRLRIRSTQNKELFFKPCGNYPGEVEDYMVLIAANTTEYCPVVSKYTRNEFIREVEISDLYSKTNGYDYSDYSPFRSANVHPGESYSIRLQPKIVRDTITLRWRVYVDYDMNGDFLGANELVFSEGSKEEITGTFTVPSDAIYGKSRIRIMMQRGDTPEPCEDITAGEVEDYGINIKPRITSIENIATARNQVNLLVYPNPGTGSYQLEIPGRFNAQVELDVVNSLGQVVYRDQLQNTNPGEVRNVDLSHLPDGLYYFFLRNESGSLAQKRVIKQR